MARICERAQTGGAPLVDCTTMLLAPFGLCQLQVLTFMGPAAVWITRVGLGRRDRQCGRRDSSAKTHLILH